MEAATVTAAGHRPSRAGKLLRPLAFLTGPTAVLALFFIGPMVVMLVISLQYGVLSGQGGFTLSNFTNALTDPLQARLEVTHRGPLGGSGAPLAPGTRAYAR